MRYSHILLLLLDMNADAIEFNDWLYSKVIRQVGRYASKEMVRRSSFELQNTLLLL
jgi:hypothetical protein